MHAQTTEGRSGHCMAAEIKLDCVARQNQAM